MKIVDIENKDSIQNAAQVLKRGGVLIFPTDTVYGIGSSLNKKATQKLYKVKNRPIGMPTAILLTKELFNNQIRFKDPEIKKEFLAGTATIILPANLFEYNFPEMIISDDKIGVRLPDHAWLEKLINLVGPIVASSANKKGESAPKDFSEVDPKLIEEVDLTIKSDEDSLGRPSKVYDLTTGEAIRE